MKGAKFRGATIPFAKVASKALTGDTAACWASGGDTGAMPDLDIAEDFGAGADHHSITNFRMPVAGLFAGAAKRHVVQHGDVVPDDRGLAHHETGRVVEENAPADLRRVYAYFPWLEDRASQEAGTLSGGEQQMLALARAVLQRPRLMLLDEPSLGLSPKLVKEIFDIIARINKERGVTVLLVEQNANMALRMADRAYVLETGRIALEGSGPELLGNDAVRKSYLGEL